MDKKLKTKTLHIDNASRERLILMVNGMELATKQARYIQNGYNYEIEMLLRGVAGRLGIDIKNKVVDWGSAVSEGTVSVRDKTKEELEAEKKAELGSEEKREDVGEKVQE